MESVKWSLLATGALLVVTVTVPTSVFATSDEKATPDEKADAQYDKGHVDSTRTMLVRKEDLTVTSMENVDT